MFSMLATGSRPELCRLDLDGVVVGELSSNSETDFSMPREEALTQEQHTSTQETTHKYVLNYHTVYYNSET